MRLGQNTLIVKGLSFSYASAPLLADIDFACTEGEIVGLVAPSGYGKSTLALLLAGILIPHAGSIELAGQSIRAAASRQEVALVQQHAVGLLPYLNVYANAALPLTITKRRLSIAGLPIQDRRRVVQALSSARILHAARMYPDQLSGGMVARAVLARAIAQRPRLLILDEPFSSLDEANCQNLYADIQELVQKKRLTVLLISHRLTEVVYLSNRIFMLRRNDSPESIGILEIAKIDISSPRTPDVYGAQKFSSYVENIRQRLASLEAA